MNKLPYVPSSWPGYSGAGLTCPHPPHGKAAPAPIVGLWPGRLCHSLACGGMRASALNGNGWLGKISLPGILPQRSGKRRAAHV